MSQGHDSFGVNLRDEYAAQGRNQKHSERCHFRHCASDSIPSLHGLARMFPLPKQAGGNRYGGCAHAISALYRLVGVIDRSKRNVYRL
jgi:hypothetical protein